MEEQPIKIFRWLYPVSWLYGTGVYLRNKLFDWGWLQSKSFSVPVICIGNLVAGGTGKTPHTEYLIRLLSNCGWNVATLSRGYKRKSKGYVLADAQSSAQQIGDEPKQMKGKFPDIRVAVDKDRCHGIEKLLALENPPVDVILLDDAFQHRYVKAGLNILLTDYHRLLCDDALLPAGQLREPAENKQRAQVVIVTKCPDDLKPIDFNIITKKLHLYPYQKLFFSGFQYGQLYPAFPQKAQSGRFALNGTEQLLLVTGIASPVPLLKELKPKVEHLEHVAFRDHHHFTKNDLLMIRERFNRLKGSRRLIVTTEKDAARLKEHPLLPAELKPFIYALPVEIKILQRQQPIFNQTIIDYVRTNTRNSNFPERENAYTT